MTSRTGSLVSQPVQIGEADFNCPAAGLFTRFMVGRDGAISAKGDGLEIAAALHLLGYRIGGTTGIYLPVNGGTQML